MLLKFLIGVHLSQKFGGIEHGQKLKDKNIKKGAVVEIADDELAGHLIEKKYAEQAQPAPTSPKEPKEPKKSKEAAE